MGTLFAAIAAELLMRAADIKPARHERPKTVVVEGGAPVPNVPGGKFVKVASRLKSLGVDMGEYVPNTVFKTVYDSNPRGYFDPDNSVLNRINSLGIRGPDVREPKTTGTIRILGIGDSFTYGPGVREEDTFLRRLETSLNERPDPGTRYEVINAGIEGYNTRDEILTLEHRWLSLNPDLILIGFYLNDCYLDYTFLNRGEEQGVNKPKPPGLAQHSYLWDYLQHSWSVWRESRRIADFYKRAVFSQADKVLAEPGQADGDWQVSRAALVRATEIARERGIKLGLVIFPELYRLDDRYPFLATHRYVTETCRQLGIPVLDLLDTFKGHRDRDLWVHPADHHPNEVGHRMAAEAILKFLQQQKLLPAPSSVKPAAGS